MRLPKSKQIFPKVKPQRRQDDSFYHNTHWRKLRDYYIKSHPLCEECKRKGRVRKATEVDHITPISDGGSRYNTANLQALCKSCHSRKTMKEINKKRYKE